MGVSSKRTMMAIPPTRHPTPYRPGRHRRRPSPTRVGVEVIETVVLVILFTLMVRFFAVESYRIPTPSMQPTTMGDHRVGLFDRILVSKLSYLVDKPERWDIIVFKYPLDTSLNFIKRVVGLPGETVVIAHGDIYTAESRSPGGRFTYHIARKPGTVRNAMLRRVFPSPVEGHAFESFFEIGGQGWREQADNGFVTGFVTANHGLLRLATRKTIRDNDYHGYEPEYLPPGFPADREVYAVGDLAVDLLMRFDGPGGRLHVAIREGARVHHATVDSTAAMELRTARRSGSRADQEVPQALGRRVYRGALLGQWHRLRFSNVDDMLSLEIDGRELLALPYESPMEEWWSENRIVIELSGPGALRDVSLARDIYYLDAISSHESTLPPFQVPAKHLFALGDNVRISADGRRWTEAVYQLAGRRTVRGDWQPAGTGPRSESNPRVDPDGRTLFTTDLAETVTIPPGLAPTTIRPSPFIPENYLLGKAMAIYWPLRPFSRVSRYKLLH